MSVLQDVTRERIQVAWKEHSFLWEVVTFALVELSLIPPALRSDSLSTGDLAMLVLVLGLGALIVGRSMQFMWHYLFTAPRIMLVERDSRLADFERRFELSEFHSEMELLGPERRQFWPNAQLMFRAFTRACGYPDADLNNAIRNESLPNPNVETLLLRFAYAVYPSNARAAMPELWYEASPIAQAITEDQFKAFDEARRKLRNYWQRVADRLGSSASFDSFATQRALIVHPLEHRLLAYFDIALAAATGKAHLLALANEDYPGWKVIDRYQRGSSAHLASTQVQPSTIVTALPEDTTSHGQMTPHDQP